MNEDDFPEEGEEFLLGDNISNVVYLGKYCHTRKKMFMFSIEKTEMDSDATHFMKIPKLPEFEG